VGDFQNERRNDHSYLNKGILGLEETTLQQQLVMLGQNAKYD